MAAGCLSSAAACPLVLSRLLPRHEFAVHYPALHMRSAPLEFVKTGILF
jgi:hypothetical protein